MSLFLSHSTLQNQFLDHNSLNVSETIEHDCLSVLHKLHDQVNGPQLVQVVVQPLAKLFNPAALSASIPAGIQSASVGQSGNNSLSPHTSTYMMSPDTAQALIARLDTDRDVNWLMEIIGYGLSMPFSLTGEQDSVKDCCTIYLEWLSSSLLPFNEQNDDSKYQQLSKLVPVPIRNDPNRYCRKMLSHLYNVFLPRQTICGTPASNSNQKDQSESNIAALSRQAVLCHRVLRTLENIAQNRDNLMDNETWDHLIALLLTVNNKLLSPPTQPDIGTQLQDRVLGVLFDLMLIASSKSILTPSHWRTLHEMCLTWRHRPALVDHWRRVTLLLTKKVVRLPMMNNLSNRGNHGPIHDNSMQSFDNTTPSSALEASIIGMTNENLSQTWYRYLNLIGNPVDLTDPSIISKTDEFKNLSLDYSDLSRHPSLSVLPQMFMTSMAAIRDFVDTFLGIFDVQEESLVEANITDRLQSTRNSITSLTNTGTITSSLNQSQPHGQQPAVTPTQARKVIKSISMKSSKALPFTSPQSSTHTPTSESNNWSYDHTRSDSMASSNREQVSHITEQQRNSLGNVSLRSNLTSSQALKLSPDRPKSNSLLHLFGDWLFSAALIGSELNHDIAQGANVDVELNPPTSETQQLGERPSPHSRSSSVLSRKTQGSISKQHSSNMSTISGHEQSNQEVQLSAACFETGQAEAMAILCRIFSSKATSEELSPNYLSRFYLCLQHCLTFKNYTDRRGVPQASNDNAIKRHLLASILTNSGSLFQRDLDGINLLIPSFLAAIEFFFECGEREMPIQPPPRQHNRSGSIKQPSISNQSYDLRKACIHTLLNFLAYPNHFKDLGIRNCLNDTSPAATFGSLRPRLIRLLFIALQSETDSTNMQILFGGLSLTIYDLVSGPAINESIDQSAKTSRNKHETESGLGGGDSLKSSLDSPSLQRQDETSSQRSFMFSSNNGFLVKSLHVTCNLLLNTWKHDTQVSLAALDLLTMIARVTASSKFLESEERSRKSSLTRSINNNYNDSLEMKNEYDKATRWICDYICNQCSRPPPAHSRDMHSTIVAAYHCLAVWFFNHPYLLNDKSCVNFLMEVIELGVSGQKSRSLSIDAAGKEIASIISKGDKVLKPSSMRVRDAAEFLLNVCMINCQLSSKSDIFEDTALDELNLVEMFGKANNTGRQIDIFRQFRYFSDEDSVIFSLYENLQNDPSVKDSVLCLLRTPFGKYCCRFKFNPCSDQIRDKIISNRTIGLIKRPFQCSTPTSETRPFNFLSGQNKSLYFNNNSRYFPETIENIQLSELDKLVDTIEDYFEYESSENPKLKNDLEKLTRIFQHQILAEQNVMSNPSRSKVLCNEPQPQGEFDAVRIFISQLGLKSALSVISSDDNVSQSFIDDLRSLDRQPMKTCDSAYIFYVRRNRTSPREILESVRERRNVSLEFFGWLHELAKPTDVKRHNRWTGKLSNSWKIQPVAQDPHDPNTSMRLSRNQMLNSDHGGSLFDGDRMTLYWSDMCQELAFLVPNRIEKSSQHLEKTSQISGEVDLDNTSSDASSHCRHQDSHNSDVQSLCSVASDTSSQSNRVQSQQGSPRGNSSSTRCADHRDSSSVSRQSIAHKKKSTYSFATVGCDTNLIICWLESSDDLAMVPIETLLSVSETGYLVEDDSLSISDSNSHVQPGSANIHSHSTTLGIQNKCIRSREYAIYYISPMKNGLFKINLQISFGRQNLALPLVDGMTVSQRNLSSLIRESVLNLCRRRRLDADSYQSPHVRRRLKIQEICNNYKISNRFSPAEYYNNLFRNKAVH